MLKINTSKTTALAARARPKFVLPADILSMPEVGGFSFFWDDADHVTRSGSAIVSANNLATPANPWTQALSARAPVFEADPYLGREAARFAADYTTYMLATAGTINYSGPFTMWAVVRMMNNAAKTNANIMGGYGASAPNRAFINHTAEGKISAFYGDDGEPGIAFPQVDNDEDRWGFVAMSYDGSTYAKLRVNGGVTILSDGINTEVSALTALHLGYSASGGASFSGLMSHAGFCTGTDMLASANAAKLDAIESMMRTVYRSSIPM